MYVCRIDACACKVVDSGDETRPSEQEVSCTGANVFNRTQWSMTRPKGSSHCGWENGYCMQWRTPLLATGFSRGPLALMAMGKFNGVIEWKPFLVCWVFALTWTIQNWLVWTIPASVALLPREWLTKWPPTRAFLLMYYTEPCWSGSTVLMWPRIEAGWEAVDEARGVGLAA